jgi:hypothetical protein
MTVHPTPRGFIVYRARSGWRGQVGGIAGVSLTLRRVCRLPAHRPPPGARHPASATRCPAPSVARSLDTPSAAARPPRSLYVVPACTSPSAWRHWHTPSTHRASTTTDNSLEPDLPCALYRKSPDLSAPSRAAWAGLPPPLALLEFGGNYLLDDFQRGLGEKRRWVNSRAPFGVQQNFAAACVLASVPKKELGTVDLTVHVR